jgi:hypothetical protein
MGGGSSLGSKSIINQRREKVGSIFDPAFLFEFSTIQLFKE